MALEGCEDFAARAIELAGILLALEGCEDFAATILLAGIYWRLKVAKICGSGDFAGRT